MPLFALNLDVALGVRYSVHVWYLFYNYEDEGNLFFCIRVHVARQKE